MLANVIRIIISIYSKDIALNYWYNSVNDLVEYYSEYTENHAFKVMCDWLCVGIISHEPHRSFKLKYLLEH